MELGTVGILLTILCSAYFSRNFVKTVCESISSNIDSIHVLVTRIWMIKSLEEVESSKSRFTKEKLNSFVSNYRDNSHRFIRVLRCNVTIAIWALGFALITYAIDSFLGSTESVVLNSAVESAIFDASRNSYWVTVSVFYIFFLCYSFRPIWQLLDSKHSDQPFFSIVKKHSSTTRYPVLFLFGVLSFPFIFYDYASLIVSPIESIFSLGNIMMLTFFIIGTFYSIRKFMKFFTPTFWSINHKFLRFAIFGLSLAVTLLLCNIDWSSIGKMWETAFRLTVIIVALLGLIGIFLFLTNLMVRVNRVQVLSEFEYDKDVGNLKPYFAAITEEVRAFRISVLFSLVAALVFDCVLNSQYTSGFSPDRLKFLALYAPLFCLIMIGYQFFKSFTIDVFYLFLKAYPKVRS